MHSKSFKNDIDSKNYPAKEHNINISEDEFEKL